jgi:hypothetical protein
LPDYDTVQGRTLTVTTILPPDRGLSSDVFIIPLAAHVMQLNTPIVLTVNMCVLKEVYSELQLQAGLDV